MIHVSQIPTVTTATFPQVVLQATTPVLVDFWAEWCHPCHALVPILEAIAVEQADRLTIVSLDVEQNEQIALRYGVLSFPTLLLFKSGQPVVQLVGTRPKATLLRELLPYLL